MRKSPEAARKCRVACRGLAARLPCGLGVLGVMRRNHMSIRNCRASALLVAFALVGCGSDDDDGGGSGGAAKAACEAYCDATVSCPYFTYADAAECKSYECVGFDQLPAECATAYENYYECITSNADVCDDIACLDHLNACL